MKQTPLRRVSAKKQARDRVLAENRRAAFDRDQWTCQAAAALPTPCVFPLVAHHVTRRSQGGGHDLPNLLTLCDFHHRWVHDHPAEAKSLGFLN